LNLEQENNDIIIGMKQDHLICCIWCWFWFWCNLHVYLFSLVIHVDSSIDLLRLQSSTEMNRRERTGGWWSTEETIMSGNNGY